MSEHIAGDDCVMRTARKHWTCVSCSGAIKPGQRYLEYRRDTHAYASGRRDCLRCAHETGLARHADPLADALEHLPARLRRIVAGAPATLIVPESGGGPSADELAMSAPEVGRHMNGPASPAGPPGARRARLGGPFAMAAGSVAGTIVGGLMLGVIPTGVLVPLLVALLLGSSLKVWRHEHGPVF